MKHVTALLLFSSLLCGCRAKTTIPDFHIINMSLPRSATTSFAGIFDRYRSTHEYMISETINTLMDFRENKISAERLKHFLRERDKQARHAVDSASFFFLAPEIVIDAFPDSKFFLAVRSCSPWVISMVDNSVFAHKMMKEGRATVDLSFLDRYSNVFIRNHSHEAFADMKKLRQDSRHVVTELAGTWGKATIHLLDSLLKVNKSSRLIIRIEDFNASADAMARLAGIPVEKLNRQNLHMNRDRDLKFYENLLGAELIRGACKPGQKLVDDWFTVHATEIR